MKKINYVVIILNYNTADEANEAAESVVENSRDKNILVCIADNGSQKNGYDEINTDNDCVIRIDLKKNCGYAMGNNRAVHSILQEYDPKYIVIMNPDVRIKQKYLIENLIKSCEEEQCQGAQPLVNTRCWQEPANMQTNIRRLPENFGDVLVYISRIARIILRQRKRKLFYEIERPYKNRIKFLVPSGAFFILNTNAYLDVEGFDENTFLYCEEIILGQKLKEKNYELLFCPEFQVEHYHGKSTGSHHKKSKLTRKCLLESWTYYCDKYISKKNNNSKIIRQLVKLIINFDL